MQTLKKLFFAIVLLIAIVSFSRCIKKGKDDPFISFLPRDARLANTWKLKSAEASNASAFGGSSYTTVTDGILSSTGNPYSLELVIKKDGKS